MIELDKGPHVKWAESMAEMLLEKKEWSHISWKLFGNVSFYTPFMENSVF